jgi:hypothetical protein
MIILARTTRTGLFPATLHLKGETECLQCLLGDSNLVPSSLLLFRMPANKGRPKSTLLAL